MPRCLACGNVFSDSSSEAPLASISGSILGDECTESYFLCDRCGSYTVEVYWDIFMGDGQTSTRGPLSKKDGERQIDVIRQCQEPWNKKCRCKAHLAHFDGNLD